MGDASTAVDRMLDGGLLVVPAAPALKDLQIHPAYREALLAADMVIPDSAYMVLIWSLIGTGRRIRRLSGLAYLRELLRRDQVRRIGSTFWIMAGAQSAALNLSWLRQQDILIPSTHVYQAPIYGSISGSPLQDPELLNRVEQLRPDHIVVTVGGGTQERLGLYLRQNLSYLPGIHCIGAAIAFLSGDQVAIPAWADTLYLGWLFRVLDDPKRYGPRYWAARDLLRLIVLYRDKLPPLLLP